MNIPNYQILMLSVLKHFSHGESTVAECIPSLREELGISDADAEILLPSGRMTYLYNRAHWARTYLGKAGLLESPRRGIHVISQSGLEFLKTNPTELNNKVLSGFEPFREWKDNSFGQSSSGTEQTTDAALDDDDLTPEEFNSICK